ncbi:MAG TPA: SdrD B-like domain-containing protein, partial [Anaerolineales bacterium]
MIRERPIRRRPILTVAAMVAALAVLLSSCAPSGAADGPTVPTSTGRANPTLGATAPATATALPTAQPTAGPVRFGPSPQDFPPGINPLTGQPVADPALLKIPALLISISHFPPTARPQAGLSFAPYVFEFSITEGETRFLTTFYGQYPAPEIPMVGDCVVRQGAFMQTGTLLGSRVWLDINKNGIQDTDEPGIGGVCVNLYDSRGQLAQKTTTDSNGYYGFNVQKGETYTVQFVKPAYLDFSPPNIGDENHDSDADPSSGRTAGIHVTGDNLLVDAGMFLDSAHATPTPNPATAPKPQVGPVRSGRLLYAY